ncbi:MAG: MFS transporter [Proteobacteria bacterium]|nr:MFS transporter [Pseudomonadota bacterium]
MSEPFAGWRMVGMGFGTQALAIGFTLGTFGVFLAPMEEAFGASRGQVSLGLALMNLFMNLSLPWVGRALDRGSPRRIMALGALLNVAALLCVAASRELWQMLAAFGLLASLGTAMMGPVASSTLMANWFEARRGLALGIANCGAPLGVAVFALAAGWSVDALGWRTTLLAYSGLTLGLALPMAWWGVVDRPQNLGQRPDGAHPPAPEAQEHSLSSEPDSASAEEAAAPVWTNRALLANAGFWSLAMGMGIPIACSIIVTGHLVAFAMGLGVSGQMAAGLLSLQGLAAIPGTFVFGLLADRLNPRGLLWGCIGMQMAVFAALRGGPDFSLLLPLVAVQGICMGGIFPVGGAMIGARFGAPAFGQVLGMVFLVTLPLAFAGPPLAGMVYDASGTYAGVFLGLIAIYALAAAALLRPRRPAAA